MRLLHFIEIENFKTFGDRQRVELGHPAVIIGPNNCGKTSVIQALALWSQAVRTWHGYRKDSEAKERTAASLNRLNIVAVPVQRTRFFWHRAQVRTGNKEIPVRITVGVEYQGKVEPLTMRFRNQGEDLVYCTPENGAQINKGLVSFAADLHVELLYPMSGLETEEPALLPGRIEVLLGQGQTAQVLRNLCLMVFNKSETDWRRIVELMKRLFRVDLGKPEENPRGAIDLTYSQPGVKALLDLSTAGRGFLQMLLVFAYLFSHKKSVLLVDEPDAHLEILRQKQVFVLLRDIAAENGSQVVIVTHSEVILNEALGTNLTLLMEGRAESLVTKAGILESLRMFGAEHYVRARERGYVLYVEGGTDVDVLRALAERIGHPICGVWDERINVCYVENNYSEVSTESELERVEDGYGIDPRDHFNKLRKLLPELKGLAILDNDGRSREDRDEGAFRRRYWRRYEIENYFLTPSVLNKFVENERQRHGLFVPPQEVVDKVLDQLILEQVFQGNAVDLRTWREAPASAARLIWESKTERLKLSGFAEEFFRRLRNASGLELMLTKSEFHRLVEFADIETLDPEVAEKLTLLQELFETAPDAHADTEGIAGE
jgi:ABC-type branched-subunit amino acid transport system ATPase component